MTGHTPGPWVARGGNVLKAMSGPDGYEEYPIAQCRDFPPVTSAQRLANAALIATAPEQQAKIDALAAALEGLTDAASEMLADGRLPPMADWYDAIDRARASLRAIGRGK